MLMRRGLRGRLAFTLVEIIVALVVLAVLAAMLYPTAAGQLRQGQSTALANQLDNLRVAIANYRTNVQRFPSQLTQLTAVPPGSGANDLCGTALPAANIALWRGPYITQVILATGMPVGDATIQNAITRVPAGGVGQPGTLQITVADVDNDYADDLERQFDGNANFATGTITWTATTGTLGTLVFQVPVRGC
jgi:prepilin-type N-terminal cleavage/methylation domain-containing protein